jgi:hypothetical protein
MDRYQGEQLSLIAETDDYTPVGDWAHEVSVQERSREQHRAIWIARANDGGQNKNYPTCQLAPHHGGQVQTRTTPSKSSGGQLGGLAQFLTCPPSTLFDRHEGDEGTWTEIKSRKYGEYKYLRWRDFSGKKRSKYLGKV